MPNESTYLGKKGKEKNLLKLKQVVEIKVGQSWLEHLRNISASDIHPVSFDFCELFDHVDIIVAGVNLTARIENEYIIPFFSKLCEALNRLSIGDSRKAIVEFQKEPWDFVLQRNDSELLISVISIDSEMRIVCLNQPINYTSFAAAVRQEARIILDDLLSLVGSASFNAHPEVSRLILSLSDVPETVGLPVETDEFDLAPNTLGVSFPGFSLSIFFEPNLSFFQYQPEIAFDLHALLVRGEVLFECGEKTFSIGEHVFLTLSTLLKNCGEWMTLFSQPRSFEFEIQSSFHLRIRSAENGIWEIGTTTWSRVDPKSLLESILSICLNFAQKLESLNPAIIGNQRFSDFQGLTIDLKNHWEDLCDIDFFNDEPESFLENFAGLKPRRDLNEAPYFRFDFAKLRAIHPAHQWSFQGKGISFDDVFAIENALIVPSRTHITRLALDTGEVEWRTKTQGASSQVFRQKSTFLRAQKNTLSAFDLQTGDVVERVEEERSLLTMHNYDETLVFSTEQGIVGRATTSLEEQWFYPVKRKVGADAVSAGPVYTVLSNAGVLHAINPITGERLWKVKIGGTTISQPRSYRSRIFIVKQSSYQFQLSCMLAFTGREVWDFEEEGLFGGQLFFRGDHCIFSLEKNGGVDIVGLCLKTQVVSWRIPISSPRGYYPNFIFFGNRAIAKSNSAETLCFETDSGNIIWRAIPDSSLLPRANLKLVLVRDAFISYCGRIEIRSLDDGELIRDFGDTMIEAKYFNVFNPLNIVTGERGDGIDQDRLVSFTIQHFLAMVELPKNP